MKCQPAVSGCPCDNRRPTLQRLRLDRLLLLPEAVEARIDRILSKNLIHHCQHVRIQVLLGD